MTNFQSFCNKYAGIVEKNRKLNKGAFQYAINDTLTYTRLNSQQFYRPTSVLLRSIVSSFSLLPLQEGCGFGGRFLFTPLSCMELVPCIQNTGIGLQYMQKLGIYPSKSEIHALVCGLKNIAKIQTPPSPHGDHFC